MSIADQVVGDGPVDPVMCATEAGAIATLRASAGTRGQPYLDCYCTTPLDDALARSAPRTKVVPEAHIRDWWSLLRGRPGKRRLPLHDLDMLKPVEENVARLLDLVARP